MKSEANTTLGAKKRRLFTALMLALPVLLFLLLEGGFRLFGVFEREPLFLSIEEAGVAYYQVNTHVARRYFNPGGATIPGAIPEKFRAVKPANTIRIFTLGGSTTAGFPFDCQVAFPQQLRYILANRFPSRKFEVINLGISAVNSHTVLDFMPDVLEMEPDHILVYMGHNEFYGAFGSGSAHAIPGGAGAVRLYFTLQKLRVTEALRRGLFTLTQSMASKGKGDRRSLMQAVVGDPAIAHGSSKWVETHATFETNLHKLVALCHSRGVPVILSNLVSNVRDLPPLGENSDRTRHKGSTDWQASMTSARAAVANGDLPAARRAYEQAMVLDSTAAVTWFELGRTCASMGDSLDAARYLAGAKDRDVVRFRASERINDIIANVAASSSATFLDMQRRFAGKSAQGLVGKELMCDHLHPNPIGYHLMASAFFEALRSELSPVTEDTTFALRDRPYHVTTLDWDIGLLKIHEMTNSWPFPERDVSFDDYPGVGDPKSVEIARHYLFVENKWSIAHDKMAAHLISKRDFEGAREEYRAVAVFAPDDPTAYTKIAETYALEENWAAREQWLRHALQRSSHKGMPTYQIAIAQWKQGNLEAASRTMQEALKLSGLSSSERLNAAYYLAGFYFEGGRVQAAAATLQSILRESPNFSPARAFLNKIRRGSAPK